MNKFDNVYILVPLYNEEQVISDTIEGLKKYFNNILIINDGSSDSSLSIISDLGVEYVSHSINLGVGAAVQTGFEFILDNRRKCSAIITFDADGQHRAEDAQRIAQEIEISDKEIIFGSRFLGFDKKIPIVKRLVLKTVCSLTKFITGVNLTDAHNGLKGYKVSAINKININLDGYAYESELIRQVQKHNISFKEVPTDIEYTEYSKSKGQKILSGFIIIEDLLKLWK